MIIGAIVLVIMTVVTLMLFEIKTVSGNELGVKETWNDGVVNDILQPKTYFLFPGYSQTVYTYDVSSQVYKLSNYKVQSQEGQDLIITARLQWRREPTKLVHQHKTIRNNVEQKIIEPVLMRVIKDKATTKKATDAYSGEGLVALQTSILAQLVSTNAEFLEKGFIAENFVIEHIELDPNYITEIKAKQVATQKQLRSIEEQKAADAAALVAKALAQADLNKRVVEAERDKQVMVLQAQAEQEKAVLAAKAEQQKLILEAEGTKQASIAKADGVLAMGKSEAEAQKLRLQAYAVPGADAFVKVEVAKQIAMAYQNIKGYLPADMKLNLLTDSFSKSVDSVTGNLVVPMNKN